MFSLIRDADFRDLGLIAEKTNRHHQFLISSQSMKLNDIDLNLLSAFDALFVERNVTNAARRMGIGQSAMSDTLRRLRALFGDELFIRASGAMQPTPKAKALAQEIGPLLVRMRSIMDGHVSFLPQEAKETFTIASTDFTTLVLLPPLLVALNREAPNIDLRIAGYEKNAIGAMLDRGEVDLAIGVFPDPPQNMIKSRLFEERFIGLGRADHQSLRSGTVDIKTFADLPHALVSVRRDERGAIDKALDGLGLSRRIALVVPYMLLLPKVMAVSDLIAILPERAARSVSGPDLICFELPFETPTWSVDMLWNPAARTDQATAWLRNLIVLTARSL
jgi:DNA-binding transcriptional LysR family regulator